MDLCCGMTMVAKLQSVYTEGSVLIHDVPLLYCPTCCQCMIAPEIDFDYQMFSHYCETDGLRSASLSDAIGEDKILAVLDKYPEDGRSNGHPVTTDQIDAILDMMILARSIGDEYWYQELYKEIKTLQEILKPVNDY